MTGRGHLAAVIVLAAAFTIALPSGALAQWVEDGVALSTHAENEFCSAAVSDGAGGAIMVIRRGVPDTQDMTAQRVDAWGRVMWGSSGVEICTATSNQRLGKLVGDGAGGAIITWADTRDDSGDIYAQRVNASGTVLWTTNGVALCTATATQYSPVICSDQAGGAIVAWYDYRGPASDIYAQRIDSSGTVQWTTNGVPVCTATGYQTQPEIVSDGEGGAIICWLDARSGNVDIYAHRVDSSGALVWGSEVGVCTETGEQYWLECCSDDAGGVIITWEDERAGNDDIYAQRVDAGGTAIWTAGGVAICTAIAGQLEPAIDSDGAGGAVITWNDGRGGDSDVYAQRVDALGNVLWTADGVNLCTYPGYQLNVEAIVSDKVGGAIVAWREPRFGQYDVFAQHVDASGEIQWTASGLTLCRLPEDQEEPVLAVDGAGGAIAVWTSGDAATDIHGQRVTHQGYWGYPAPTVSSVQDVPGDQGGQVRVTFDASRIDVWPDAGVTFYSVWRALSSAAASAMEGKFARLASPQEASPDKVGKAYYSSASADWELIGTMDAHHWAEYGYTVTTLRDSTSVDPAWEYYCVSAHGDGAFDFWNSTPDSGYSVDNLSPIPPAALAGEYTGDSNLWLHWNPNTEADLAYYAVYRGSSPDFVPDETNLVGTSTDTSLVDCDFGFSGEYYYKVSAIDVHENESGFAVLTPDEITGAPEVERPYANLLLQNVPNPFVSSTRIAFTIEEEGHVRLRVFDAKGRLVRVIVDEVRGPNRYIEGWDAHDSAGRSLPAGNYFYRLELPGWSGVKKMTLMR